ncbi:DJ-1/PfpI family protein [Candidatus Woesearchaeota archaeon]|jgi:protease I|nr:DJ-1/PfpI family protein [Candidatus Woesearchaeota archaeon]MBT6045047.1 DJ-1/PfpI family protein [Candidatus Woesearchaeota archaeon]
MADVLIIIAPQDFKDEEYFHVREELENAGHKVVVSSLQDVASSVENKEVVTDVLIDEADVADYDALVLVGGAGASVYFENEKVLEMCYQTVEQGKLIAAICIAPGILARAGVLAGKNATSFESELATLDEAGAITSDSHVVVDGQIVTADGPQAAREFGKKIAELLKEDNEEEVVEETKEYYPSNGDDEKTDDGFDKNEPYYGDDKHHEKRVVEEDSN